MEMLNRINFSYGTEDEAFPPVDPLIEPMGDHILVQLRIPKNITSKGVYIPTDVSDTEFWLNQIGKVRSVGPVAYKFSDDLRDWPEGPWCKVGDFVRVPRYGGDRWTIKVPNAEYEASMVIFRAREIIGSIPGGWKDAVNIKGYL